MSLWLLLSLVATPTVGPLTLCEVPPRIDGVIEEVWQRGDSAYGFIQSTPDEGEPATEPTTVYLLADAENLYAAFRCYTSKRPPTIRHTWDEDRVYLYLDTFGSKSTAYFFCVTISGIHDEGMVLDDGSSFDYAWETVWYSGARCFDDRFEVELKIPFKSIRYKEGISEWGINFRRYTVATRENVYWTEVTVKEDFRVSRFGVLKGISPRVSGYYFELYPEGFLRYDEYREEKSYKPSLSLNFKWDLTPQSSVVSTVNPDFAHIEADPYTLNLSRYPVRLAERRPFFMEGSEVFRMADFGSGEGFFTPLEIFYSRRIGKPLPLGGSVPILGGLKFVNKGKPWEFGCLGAVTDETETEPERYFGTFRAKRSVFANSELGILASGSGTGKENYNYGIGLDGVHRSGPSQFLAQGAISDRNGKQGWAASSGAKWFIKEFVAFGSLQVISDSFDVTDIGYVPWAGQRRIMAAAGPFKQYKAGVLRTLWLGPGGGIWREAGADGWSRVVSFYLNLNFRNDWGGSGTISVGQNFEADTNYLYRDVNLSIWGNSKLYNTYFGGWYGYTYNYARRWLAYQGIGWFGLTLHPLPKFSPSINGNIWCEWDPEGRVEAITSRITPRVDFYITKDMSLGVYSELVMIAPQGEFSETRVYSNRIGGLLSWKFLPKSWLYIALNDYREDFEGNLAVKERIGAVKAKYLIYF